MAMQHPEKAPKVHPKNTTFLWCGLDQHWVGRPFNIRDLPIKLIWQRPFCLPSISNRNNPFHFPEICFPGVVIFQPSILSVMAWECRDRQVQFKILMKKEKEGVSFCDRPFINSIFRFENKDCCIWAPGRALRGSTAFRSSGHAFRPGPSDPWRKVDFV